MRSILYCPGHRTLDRPQRRGHPRRRAGHAATCPRRRNGVFCRARPGRRRLAVQDSRGQAEPAPQRRAARSGPARRAGRAGVRRGVRGPADRQVRQRAAHRGGRHDLLAAAHRARAGRPRDPDGRATDLRPGRRLDGRRDERAGGARGARVPAPADHLVPRVLQLRRVVRRSARRTVRLGWHRSGSDVYGGGRAAGRCRLAGQARAAARAGSQRPDRAGRDGNRPRPRPADRGRTDRGRSGRAGTR